MIKTETTTLKISSILTTTNLFYLTIFAIPMFNHANQILIGSAVNLMLFLGAQKLNKKELISLAILPSLGAIANGALFGSLTVFLLYFAPFIWLGNYLQMITFKKTNHLPKIISIILASLAKAGLLFIIALIFTKFNLVPKIFLTAMGLVQLITALIGGTLALILSKTKFLANQTESANE